MVFLKSLFNRQSDSPALSIGEVVEPLDVVRAANARMIKATAGVHFSAEDDPFVHYQIPRPTRRELAEAGSRALREVSAN